MPNVLIGSGPLRGQPGRFRDILVEAGFTPIDPPGSHTLTAEDLRASLPGADAMVAGGESLPAALIALAPRLRVIARTGVGYDNVDVAEANRRGIAVGITPGTNQESVAEQAFALLLALTRRVVVNSAIIRDGGWDRTLPAPLRGKTLGLLGLGRIGRAMATRALAFGMRVLAFDVVPIADFDARHGIARLELDTLLAESDVVSLHLPLTESTRGLINRRTLALMPPGSYLLNTARGGLVVEADLCESLISGHLAGAGLDVTGPEPPARDSPLRSLPNVVLSPHIGGIDARAMADMAEMAAQTIIDLHQGRWPAERIVNPEIAQDWRW